ncbi:hypothetical protein F8M41_015447 [Gigaspora margarita]|uniref:Uncharacterized protein n=1 Tax=Gigaspora margarita TaxID=4874 RepID=A0A8H3ZZF2_GIGMA|nr:hypothetical protein F8M41_015447 [Gigaspora margarita]
MTTLEQRSPQNQDHKTILVPILTNNQAREFGMFESRDADNELTGNLQTVLMDSANSCDCVVIGRKEEDINIRKTKSSFSHSNNYTRNLSKAQC